MVSAWSRSIESLISRRLKNAMVFCVVLCAQTKDVMHGSAVSNKVIKVGVNFFSRICCNFKNDLTSQVVEILKKDSC